MSEQRHSSIKFSLEESVLFKNGQEVDELISISLNPDISIIEEEDFVMLRGSLTLMGEYKRIDDTDLNTEEEHAEGRYVQQVDNREDGESAFSHQFPVDITIPKSRITELNDVYVEVEAFDYELPETSCLNIEAEVHVYGLHEEQDTDQIVEESYPSPSYEEVGQREEEAEFEEDESIVEVGLQEYEEAEDVQEEFEPEPVIRSEFVDDDEQEDEAELYTPFTAEARASEDYGDKQYEIERHPQFPFPFQSMPEMNMDEMAHRLKGFFQQNIIESTSSSPDDPSTTSVMEAESPVHESSSHENKEMDHKAKTKKKKDKYKSMSFADFFARKEEEASSKLKVCLVQHGDSIERLADKYEVTVQQLLRANQLDPNHEVYEGQVLYIPAKTAYRK